MRDDAEKRIISAKDIRVLFFTCNRKDRGGIQRGRKVEQGEHYIYQTLSSLFMCDPMVHDLAGVDLLIGTSNQAVLLFESVTEQEVVPTGRRKTMLAHDAGDLGPVTNFVH